MDGDLLGVIDLGGTTIKWSVLDAQTLTLIQPTQRVPTPSTLDVKEFLDGFEPARVDFARHSLAGVGVASPRPYRRDLDGRICLAEGSLKVARSSPDGFPIERELENLFDVPVTVRHDGTCNIVAEHRLGCARDWSTVALLINGTGIGFSALRNGVVVEDENGNGPEPAFVVPQGADVQLEALTAGPALHARYTSLESDEAKEEAAQWCAHWQQGVIGPLVAECEAEHLIVTGGVAERLGAFYRSVLLDALAGFGVVEVVAPRLGPDVGLFGAGLRFLEKHR